MNLKGSVPIDLDRRRQLRFDENAMAELTDATGKTLGDLLKTAESGDWFAMRALIWAGLLHEDRALLRQPKEGMRTVGQWMSQAAAGETVMARLKYFSERLEQAFRSSFGEEMLENPTAGRTDLRPTNGTHSEPSSSPPAALASPAASS